MTRVIVPLDARRDRPLWQNFSFMLMWVNVAACGFGDRLIEMAAMPMLGVKEGHAQAAAIQSSIYFFFFLPWLVITPIGGWLADTLPRKFILWACDLGRALILLWAFMLVPAGLTQTQLPAASQWEVYAILAAVGALAAIFSPAKNATIPQVVPVSQLQPANSIVMGIGVVASLISFVIGGPLMDHFSVRVAILAATLAYAVSGWFFLFMRLRPHTGSAIGPKVGQFKRMLQAAGYLRHRRPVRQLAVLAILLWAVANIVAVALSALCKHRYNIPADVYMSHYSWMMGATGLGMLVGALLVAWINDRREAGLVTTGAMLPVGLCLLLLAINRSYTAGLVLAFFVGVFGNVALICVDVLTQSISPNFIRGRIFGLRDMAAMVSAVGVHFIIWRLPDADFWLIDLLYVLAFLTPVVAGIGFYRTVLAGPHRDPWANLFYRLCRLYALVWHRLRWIGKPNIPSSGPVLLAANHTTGLDPLLIQACCPRMVTWVMYTSYRFRIFRRLWKTIQPIAIEYQGGNKNMNRLREVARRLEDGAIVGIFPEGQLQREHRELQPFAPGVAMIARRSGAWIVPIWIEGTPRRHNMLWHFLTLSRSTVIIGQAYRPDPALDHAQVTEDLRRRMLDLRAALQPAEAGVPGSPGTCQAPAPAAN